MTFVEQNTIFNLMQLYESFPKVNSSCKIQFLSNAIVLGQTVMTSDYSHAAFQVLDICEEERTKLHDDILSNTGEKIVENIKNKNA